MHSSVRRRRTLLAITMLGASACGSGGVVAPDQPSELSEAGAPVGKGNVGSSGSGGTAGIGGSAGRWGSGGTSGGAGRAEGGTTRIGDGGLAPVDATTAAGARWVGRVDLSDPAAPRFAWSGTGFVATVAGTAIAVKLRTDNTGDTIFFQPVVDGAVGQRFGVAPGSDKTVTLANGLAAGDHVVEVYRETEGRYGDSVFTGFPMGTLKYPPSYAGRLIELIGDSITNGYGNLGSEPHPNYQTPQPCHYTPDTQSAYGTYGVIAARAKSADASIIAISGWGLYQGRTQGDFASVVPSVYDNALGMEPSSTWRFTQEPQAVVINLGSADFDSGDPGAPFVAAYLDFVRRIRSNYQDAWIFCTIGPVSLPNDGLTKEKAYLHSVVTTRNGEGDDRISWFDFGVQDATVTGCDWHPSAAEHKRMAETLLPQLQAKLGW